MPSGAENRAKAGQTTRLTRQVIADLVNSLKTGASIEAASEFVWISRTTFYAWQREAAVARRKHARNRTQRDRLLIEFDAGVRQAIADYAMRANMGLASAAGLTRERPKRRRTTQRVVARDGAAVSVDANGQVSGGVVIEVQITEEELAPDWRALDRMRTTRFPEEYATSLQSADTEALAPVDDASLTDALEAARRAAGLDLGVIEARSWPTEPDGPQELSAGAEADAG